MMIKSTDSGFSELISRFQIKSLPALIVTPKNGKRKKSVIIQGSIYRSNLLKTLKEIIANNCSAS